MASSSRRASQIPSSTVYLHCSQCNSQIGIFENEWTRLTSSYVLSVHPGTHFGTEVAHKTKVVPEGVSQRAVEGCTLAEVFCKKCSAAVGQYCKATATSAQRALVDQYLYKLSKTYLKDSETSDLVDPVFGFGGDFMRPGPRPSTIPRPSLSAGSRWSQTPLHTNEIPSYLQSLAASQLHTNAPTPLPSAGYAEPQDPVWLKIKSQEKKIAAQEERIQQQEIQIKLVASLLGAFQQTLDDVKSSIRELKSQNAASRFEPGGQNDFVGSLESMVEGMRNAQSSDRECQELRAENAAMKARLESVASAVSISAGDFPQIGGTASDAKSSNVLGKRKRNTSLSRSGATQPPPIGGRNGFQLGQNKSLTQIPTPQSSHTSDQDASTTSRNVSPEEHRGTLSQEDWQCSNGPPEQDGGSTGEATSTLEQHRDWDRIKRNNPAPSLTGRLSQVSASELVRSLLQGPSNPIGQEKLVPRGSTQDDDNQNLSFDDTTRTFPDKTPPQETNAKAPLRTEPEHVIGNQKGMHMEVDLAAASGLRRSMGDNVEFSDDDYGDTPNTYDNERHRQGPNLTQPTWPSVVEQASHRSAPNKRYRSNTNGTSSRFTDFERGNRSAPEPAGIPRTLSRHQLSSRDSFRISTPALMEEQMRHPDKSKNSGQTNLKLLNNELIELGLEEWVNRDKNCPEYRKAVDEARARKRESNKVLALALSRTRTSSRGVDGERTDLLDEAFQAANKAYVGISNEQVGTSQEVGDVGQTDSTEVIEMTERADKAQKTRDIERAQKAQKAQSTKKAGKNQKARNTKETEEAQNTEKIEEAEKMKKVQEAPKAQETQNVEAHNTEESEKAREAALETRRKLTRRQQREEDIRRRDQLAKDAMDMDD
ncbi:uncharacterized protein Z518_09205 [Rhinocladiella mackenziei CBS 650.93]|uniref:Yippee/Mis18/Cereblon domain-containing protein n=1 Tax=Rhinocladiella mackenziei CBS 650.93 TaxID=1442369 RepID=A0A0D2I6Q4_9EURO|nr:uncharacterized protein Z518_09205 [Rhinocladiella mackenziei CBS 650.93]KIX01479.1 hypothetical protein Z518_09205 [Rhinocladiella mackenziei CBS 650.93]